MSRYSGNDDECPDCGLKYRDFRTGLTYRDVYLFLPWAEDPQDAPPKRRATVLGHWHQIKVEWWKKHLDDCYLEHRHKKAG